VKGVVYMTWWNFKSCPRCNGDMFIDKDLYYGWYEQCIMCGYVYELRVMVELEHQRVWDEKEKERRVTTLSKGW